MSRLEKKVLYILTTLKKTKIEELAKTTTSKTYEIRKDIRFSDK